IITDWKKRLANEIPDLTVLFKRNKVKNVIDIGYGTGEHDIALAKKGLNILGIESSRLMHKISEEKTKNLPDAIKNRLKFMHGNYIKVLSKEKREFEAAIFMGNAFAHLVPDYKKVLTVVSDTLSSKGSVIVCQIANFEKIFKVKNRILDVNFGFSKHGFPSEHVFLRFYDPPKERGGYLTLNTAIFDNDGKRWKFRTMNSTPIVNIDKESIKKLLIKNGFKKVLFYGGEFLGPLFKNSFNSSESDWLNVVALR
ncbi:MAG: class I SAM-dependent methyltransferase, partial [Candidatus Pacearchaeota archaeon]